MGRLRVAAQLLVNAALCDKTGHPHDSTDQRRAALRLLADAKAML
jgi:hypothetical protein